MESALTQVAMQMILGAGEARADLRTAYAALAGGDVETARRDLDTAKQKVTDAHRAQTGVLQAEARGEVQESSLLFAHAQDSLMVANSELITARNLVGVVDALLVRLDRLEAATGVRADS